MEAKSPANSLASSLAGSRFFQKKEKTYRNSRKQTSWEGFGQVGKASAQVGKASALGFPAKP